MVSASLKILSVGKAVSIVVEDDGKLLKLTLVPFHFLEVIWPANIHLEDFMIEFVFQSQRKAVQSLEIGSCKLSNSCHFVLNNY